MDKQRYCDLMDNPEAELSLEEIADGWQFCHCEWDGLLIHKNDPEAEVCFCLQKASE